MLGLKGFVAAVIGGLISLPGAVIGGLLLGVIESLGAGLISSGFKDAIAFLVLLPVIFARSGRQWLCRRPTRAGGARRERGAGGGAAMTKIWPWHRDLIGRTRPRNVVALLAFALVVGTLPLWLHSPYLLSAAIFIGIFTIVTLGLCLLMGYAGQVSLGHAAFWGIGAYTSAILTVKLGVSPWLAMIAGVIVTSGGRR